MAEPTSKLKQKHLLINGTDDFEVKARGLGLMAELAPEDPMNLEILEGHADNVENALAKIDLVKEAILTLPFFGGRKLIFLKNCNFLSDTVIGKSESVLAKLTELTQILLKVEPESAQLLVTAMAVDRRRSFYKQFEKFGYCEQWDLADIKDYAKLQSWMRKVDQSMKDLGLKPETGVAERLVDLIGNDSRALHNELEKLALYLMPQVVVTEEDLRKSVSSTRELLVWDLCEAVTDCDVNESLHILRQLLVQKETEVGLLIMLSGQIRLAALGVHLLETKKASLSKKGTFVNLNLTREAEELMPQNKKGDKPNTYRLARVIDKAQKKSSLKWFKALDTIYETNLALVSSGSDRKKILETAVMKICQS